MTALDQLEQTLDAMWRSSGGRQVRFTRQELMDFGERLGTGIGHDRRDISQLLQLYRTRTDRRFVIASRGYGRAARWRLLGVRGHAATHRARSTADQARHAALDAVRRNASDLRYEVFEAMLMNGSSAFDMRRIYDAARGTWIAMLDVHMTPEQTYTEIDQLADPLLELIASATARDMTEA